jgi:hypothetical protein
LQNQIFIYKFGAMENKLNNLIETLRKLGYKDYVISPQKGDMLIKFPNTKELNHNDKVKLIKEFKVTVDVTDEEITVIY